MNRVGASAHLHGARERERRQRLRERAGRDAGQLHDGQRPRHAEPADGLRHGARDRQLHHDLTSRRDRRDDGQRAHDGDGRRPLLTRNTNGTGGNSGPATKTWVNAKISITPDATNQVGQPHTFTVTLMKDTGDGHGFVAGGGRARRRHADRLATVRRTRRRRARVRRGREHERDRSVHDHVHLELDREGDRPRELDARRSPARRRSRSQTDGVAPNSGDAVKTFVNARITITPNATNEVGQPHTFTVTLEKDTGNGAGFVPAAGEHVDGHADRLERRRRTRRRPAPARRGRQHDGNGQCTITFTSPTAGKVTGHASSTFSARRAGAGHRRRPTASAPNGPDAVKTFVDANIQITPNGDEPRSARATRSRRT